MCQGCVKGRGPTVVECARGYRDGQGCVKGVSRVCQGCVKGRGPTVVECARGYRGGQGVLHVGEHCPHRDYRVLSPDHVR